LKDTIKIINTLNIEMRNKQITKELFRSKKEYHKKQTRAALRKKLETLVDLQKLHIEFSRKRGSKMESWKKVWVNI
jgi:hypothetical protein